MKVFVGLAPEADGVTAIVSNVDGRARLYRVPTFEILQMQLGLPAAAICVVATEAREWADRQAHVVSPAMAVLRAATPDGVGAIVQCDETAAVGSRSRGGSFWFSDCWADPPDLARRALRAAWRGSVGIGPPTSLTHRLEDLGVSLDYRPASDIRTLPDVLLEEARTDAVARHILMEYGKILGDYVLAALRQAGAEGQECPLVLSGTALCHPSRILQQAIIARVTAECPWVVPAETRAEPAMGAVLLAMDTDGLVMDASRLSFKEL